MSDKSDIERILESQTWKYPKKTLKKKEKKAKKLSVPKPLKINIDKLALDIPSYLSPIPQMKNESRASFLAINLSAMTSNISKVLKNEDFNCLKIPTFPKSPFGVHSVKSSYFPTFKVIPRPSDLNLENINAIKYESGRIKRVISKSASNSSLGFTSTPKNFHSRNPSYHIPKH